MPNSLNDWLDKKDPTLGYRIVNGYFVTNVIETFFDKTTVTSYVGTRYLTGTSPLTNVSGVGTSSYSWGQGNDDVLFYLNVEGGSLGQIWIRFKISSENVQSFRSLGPIYFQSEIYENGEYRIVDGLSIPWNTWTASSQMYPDRFISKIIVPSPGVAFEGYGTNMPPMLKLTPKSEVLLPI